MESIQSERDRAIQILHFAPARSIPSVYYDKSYLCAPDGGDKAYELLRRAMMEEHVVSVGQCVLWNRQDMLALIPEENGIRVQTLFYRQQLRMPPFSAPQVQVTEAEMRMDRRELALTGTGRWNIDVSFSHQERQYFDLLRSLSI